MSDTGIAIVGGIVFLLLAGGLTSSIQEFSRPDKGTAAKEPPR
jgi:hypothetical protein